MTKDAAGKYLFCISLSELILGGGGRQLLDYQLTPRIVISIAMIVYSLIFLYKSQPINLRLPFLIIGSYIFTHCLSFLLGILHGAIFTDIVSDISQSLYFASVLFFFMVAKKELVPTSLSLIKYLGLALGIAYLSIIGLYYVDFIPPGGISDYTQNTSEAFLRVEPFFFFKSIAFVGLSSIVWIYDLKNKLKYLYSFICLLAVILTLTRGMILATFLVLLHALYINNKKAILPLALIGLFTLYFLGPANMWELSFTFGENRALSDLGRLDDINFITRSDWFNLLIGHGFGGIINTRLMVENSYMNILYKMGIPGLLFYLLPIYFTSVYTVRIWRESKCKQSKTQSMALFSGLLLFYLLSITNPFINNSLGIIYALIALALIKTIDLSRLEDSNE